MRRGGVRLQREHLLPGIAVDRSGAFGRAGNRSRIENRQGFSELFMRVSHSRPDPSA